MKKNIHKVIIIAGAFVLALVAAWIISGTDENKDISYTVLGDSTLPVVTLSAEGNDVNTLYGYLQDVNKGDAQMLITPLGQSRELKATVTTFGNAITGISYEVRSLDGSDLIEKTELENWTEADGIISAVLPIKDISGAEDGRRLEIILTTEKISEINYYTTIVDGKNYKTAEMLNYIKDFHASTFDSKKAQKYAVNWEPDGSNDDESLAFVDIHSSFKQLTYKDLSPRQTGEAIIDIVEIDETFGSFLLRFELQAENENGKTDRYYVEEFFCIQWSQLRFYLMAYERRMTQVFEAGDTAVSGDGINFGVINESDFSLVSSENGEYTAFIQAGELWSYSSKHKEVGQVFSFAASQSLLHKLNNGYGIRIISVSDNGDIIFIVYGYMLRGEHEGENGLGCYRYSREKNTLEEMAYFSAGHAVSSIESDLETLCVKKSNQIYLLFDDTVFSVSETGNEIVRVIEGAAAHNVKTNAEQSAFAWMQEADDGISSRVQVRYLDTGKTSVVSVKDSEYAIPWGFIEDDFIYTVGERNRIGTIGFGKMYPQNELVIIDENGEKIGGYKNDGIYIGRVMISDGKIILQRIKETDSGYEKIEDEVLMQSNKTIEKEEKLLADTVVEKRQRIWSLKIKKAPEYEDCSVFSPVQISYAKSILKSDTSNEKTLFYGFAKGLRVGVYESAGEAAQAVNENMGYVIDSNGVHIWHRKGKSVNGAKISLPKDVSSDETLSPLNRCMEMILKYEEIDGVSAQDYVSMSPSQLFSEKAGFVPADMTGCLLKQIFIFLEKGCPVIALDAAETPYLITGYDGSNITIYSFDKGGFYKLSQEKAAELFETGGSRFLSYVKK